MHAPPDEPPADTSTLDTSGRDSAAYLAYVLRGSGCSTS
jgi:hypothetical protein